MFDARAPPIAYGFVESNPSMTSNYFWVQTSWPDSVKYNTNHIIVVKRTP